MEQLFLEQVPFIQRAAAYACRCYGFSREEVEDFTQHVLTKICDRDYAVLRKHEQRSKLSTYLAVVVRRALLDYVNSKLGKWRPSRAATRLGRLAVEIEKLRDCDGLTVGQAIETLRSRGVTASQAELSELAAQLPLPSPRRREGSYDGDGRSAAGARRPGAEAGASEPVAAERADERVWGEERAERRRQALAALRAALAALPPEDCLIARMFGEHMSVVKIARALSLDPKEEKALYRRVERIRKRLRADLEGAGIGADDIADILGEADD